MPGYISLHLTRATCEITKVAKRIKIISVCIFSWPQREPKSAPNSQNVAKDGKTHQKYKILSINCQKLPQIYLHDRCPDIFLSIWQEQLVRSLRWQTESKSFLCASFRGLYVFHGASCVLISISARVTAHPILYCPSLCSEKKNKKNILSRWF